MLALGSGNACQASKLHKNSSARHAFVSHPSYDTHALLDRSARPFSSAPLPSGTLAQHNHPVYADIRHGGAVQQRVLGDAAVLEERESNCQRAPPMYAISERQPAIALWLIKHRGQHAVEAEVRGVTALD